MSCQRDKFGVDVACQMDEVLGEEMQRVKLEANETSMVPFQQCAPAM